MVVAFFGQYSHVRAPTPPRQPGAMSIVYRSSCVYTESEVLAPASDTDVLRLGHICFALSKPKVTAVILMVQQ